MILLLFLKYPFTWNQYENSEVLAVQLNQQLQAWQSTHCIWSQYFKKKMVKIFFVFFFPVFMAEFCFSLSFTPVGKDHISIAQQLQCGLEPPDLPTRSRVLGLWGWRVGSTCAKRGSSCSVGECGPGETQNTRSLGSGETAQWLRAIAALPENPGLIPRTYINRSKLFLTAVPGDVMPASVLCRGHKHVVYKHTHRGNNRHIKNK